MSHWPETFTSDPSKMVSLQDASKWPKLRVTVWISGVTAVKGKTVQRLKAQPASREMSDFSAEGQVQRWSGEEGRRRNTCTSRWSGTSAGHWCFQNSTARSVLVLNLCRVMQRSSHQRAGGSFRILTIRWWNYRSFFFFNLGLSYYTQWEISHESTLNMQNPD